MYTDTLGSLGDALYWVPVLRYYVNVTAQDNGESLKRERKSFPYKIEL